MGLYTSWMKNPNIAHTQTDIGLWPQTVGGSIMAYCNTHNLDPDIHQDMQDIVHQFSVGANLNWTWNPAKGCRSAGRAATLLDELAGGAQNGECGWLAWALYTLLVAPPPYGFGKNVDPHKVKTYSGRIGGNNNGVADDRHNEGEGFISTHPHAFHNLQPNTFNLNSNALDLFRWGDHVVVKYNQRFYDPSYDAFYNNLYDMALYNVARMTIEDVNPQNKKLGVKMIWRVRANGSANDRWFRQIQPSELGGYPANSQVVGPFNTAPGAPQVQAPAAPQVPANRRRNCLARAFFCCWPW
jgi:hypothetical protein